MNKSLSSVTTMSIVRQLAKLKERRENALLAAQDDLPEEIPAVPPTGPESLTSSETGLGVVDFQVVQRALTNLTPRRTEKYVKYTDSDRYLIGKYGSEYGPTAAVKRHRGRYPKLNESTVRSMKKRYEEMLKKEADGITNKIIRNNKRGRPLMLGDLDSMVQNYIRVSVFE